LRFHDGNGTFAAIQTRKGILINRRNFLIKPIQESEGLWLPAIQPASLRAPGPGLPSACTFSSNQIEAQQINLLYFAP
jgi:hypothetical protein